jgi:putative toxin-antitoxin system antitoxin component (TIGR02293 family)
MTAATLTALPRVSKAHAARPVRARGADPLAPRAGALSFIDVYRAEPLARVRMVKEGLPADYLDRLAKDMAVPKDRLLRGLGISPATVNRKARAAQPLSTEDSERALGLARLVGQVEAMVRESGNPEGFNAAQWVARWLERPIGALGGQRPASFMDTAEGQTIISNLLACAQSGTYV